MTITAFTPGKVTKIKAFLLGRGFVEYVTARKAINGMKRGEASQSFAVDERGFVDYFCGDAMARAVYNFVNREI